jgi:uncharacterized protein (DUF779 family)
MKDTQDSELTRRTVRDAYARIAQESGGCCCGSKSSCCGTTAPDALAKALGYEETDLGELPEGATWGSRAATPQPSPP